MFACFGGPCFKPRPKQHEAAGHQDHVTASHFSEDWQSVPDDVLQAMVSYLEPADVAVSRLVCRHWRSMLSCYIPALTLPTSFLTCKGARAALRSTSQHFPSVNRIALCHAGGWCDPVQARMDVEPLVRQERRAATLLEPLAAAFSQIQQLSVSDATFTRDPWPLEQLALLPKLSGLSMSWDTGLWAPGQVEQEADALQAVFSRTQLTALQLAKHAHLFLGEVPLGDSALASAAGLRLLVSLDLATVGVTDDGFGALAALTGLTALSLRGHIAVSLGALSRVFGTVTSLQSLSLAGLLPSSRDLRRIAAAHSGGGSASGARHRGSSSTSRHAAGAAAGSSASSAGSSSLGSSSLGSSSLGSSSLGSSFGRSPQQAQQQYHHHQLGGGGGAWRSSRLWEQPPPSPQQRQRQCQHSSALPPIPSGAPAGASSSNSAQRRARQQQLGSSSGSSSGGSASSSPYGSSNSGRPRHASSSSRGRFRSADWSVVLLPLRRLRSLRLQSDFALLGSCAALRSMGHVTHIELHSAAKFLQLGPQLQQLHGSLLPSWLTQLARDAAAAAVEERAGGGSKGVLRAGGAWPGLVSLHVDNLQLADGLIQGLAQLVNLKTVILAGPCLLAAQQQQQYQGRGFRPAGAQQQQQQHAGSAPGWSSAFAGLAGDSLSALPSLSGLSGQGFDCGQSKAPVGSWHSDDPASPAALAAGLVAAAAKAKLSPGSNDSGSSPTTTGTSTTATSTSTSSSSSRSSAPLFTASGMRVQLQPEHQPVAAALAALQLQQQQQQGGGGGGGGLFRSVLDADVLTRLSPLTQLHKFELHLQQQMPCGLSMTPFALAHLAVSWTGLTSLSLNMPTPKHLLVQAAAPSAAAAPPGARAGRGSIDGCQDCAAVQLLVSLGCLTSLQHLHLHMTDGMGVSEGPQAPSLPGAVLPATPEQPFAGLHTSTDSNASDSGVRAAAAAVAVLPWHLLPGSLVSLSLSGFVGLQPGSIKALAAAAETSLRHLRLMYCQVPTPVLWVLRQCLPLLQTLVVKEDGLGGVASSGIAAVATLQHLRSLGVTVAPGADVSVLGHLPDLRHLLLDGRSNTEVLGVKGLGQLAPRLKTLIMPLLHLHHTNQTLLSTLQLSLPNTHIMNVSRNFGRHHGCQWFKCFDAAQREWWAQPAHPWAWRPTLDILP